MKDAFIGVFLCCSFPAFTFVGLRIWKPAFPPETGMSVRDRLAWTIFAFGICSMLHMALYAAACEDGSYRTWETIRLHSRMFFAFAMIAVAGPLFIFWIQPAHLRQTKPPFKKPPVDNLD